MQIRVCPCCSSAPLYVELDEGLCRCTHCEMWSPLEDWIEQEEEQEEQEEISE